MTRIETSIETRLNATLAAQRLAWASDGPPSLEQRRDDLGRLKAAILSRRSELEAAVSADYGNRRPYETALIELLPLVQGINYQRRHLRRWMKPQRRHVALSFQPARAWVQYQPLGIVGIVAPWNLPIGLSLMPLATALAAGNRAIVKFSEFAPASAEALTALLTDTFAPEQVAVINGDAEVGAAFSRLALDHLFFTGSTAVGQAVMAAASERLVPVTLELGGKSPVLIDPGRVDGQTARAIASGKLANAGQICIAPDYVLVHEPDVDAFVEAYDGAVRQLQPQGPGTEGDTRIINARHHARLRDLLEDARARGATIREVGVSPAAARQQPQALAPVVVTGLRADMRLMQEEIFGPLLPVLPYADLDQAIRFVNERPRPLALYHFGNDPDKQQRVLSRTTSGNVTLNDTLKHYVQEDLPFGGVGASGIGAYHGIEGFRRFSHAKGVYQPSRWSPSHWIRPPYGRFARLVLKALLR